MPTERHRDNTFRVLCALSGLAAIWEVYTILNKEPGDTESATLRALGNGQPFLIFMWGMLSGHLWAKKLGVFLPGVLAGVLFWPLVDGQ